jgi:CRP-like cAMP-binding protein
VKRSEALLGVTLGGKYRIDAPLGSGAHGAVYRGWHLLLDLPVAIKVAFHQSGAREQRFRSEARTLMRFSHPHVVRVYDYAREPDGLAYLVQEFVEGRTLGDLLVSNGPLDAELVIEIGLQCLSALGAAHARGIIHRDVKLDNLMLRYDGDRPSVRLLDFGIAKLLDTDDDDGLTEVGGALGTPAFMAPEQINGRPVPASDLYAVGVMLYCLLTGTKPFPQKAPQVYMAHLNEPVPALPASVPAALGAIVRQAMAKTLDRRFRSADEMSAALRAVAASWTRRSMRLAVLPESGPAGSTSSTGPGTTSQGVTASNPIYTGPGFTGLSPTGAATGPGATGPGAAHDPAAAARAALGLGVPLGEADRAQLRPLALFRGLTEPELADLCAAIRLIRAPQGTQLFDAGVPSDGAYIVGAGELAAELVLPDGPPRAVARFGPGIVVGEISLIESETRSLRVRVTADATLYHIDRDAFAALRRSHHEGAYKVIRNIAVMLCDRLRDTNARIREQWQGRVTTSATLSGRPATAEPRDIMGRLRRLFGMG